MEALGPAGERASPTTCPGSLDLRRLSTRAESAYSSFSAASARPEALAPSPGTDVLPNLDWDCVRVVWGGAGLAPPDAAALGAPQRPGPAVAAHTRPRPPALQGTPGPLSRQATPLLYALAAEAGAGAGARVAEPPSPPASRAAYRQRLQGAQRRVLRETSFQRRELRMSLPARLRPTAPGRLPSAHPRSASLSHPGGDPEPARCRPPAPGTSARGSLTSQQRKWCFSEPGKLDRVGQGSVRAGEALSETCSRPGLARPEPPGLRPEAGAEVQGLPEIQHQSAVELDRGSMSVGNAQRPGSRSQSASGEVLGPWREPGGAMAVVQVWKRGCRLGEEGEHEGSVRFICLLFQAVPQGAETPRPLFQITFSR